MLMSLLSGNRLHSHDLRTDHLFMNETHFIVSSSWSAHSLIATDVSAAQDRIPSIWISEVYPNAGQGRSDAAFEWVEISNASDEEIALEGWTIADNTSSDPLDGAILPAGGSLIIAGSVDAVEVPAFVVANGRIGNGLANTGDQVRLVDAGGVVVAAASWGGDEAFGHVAAPTAEQSIQRSAPNAPLRLGSPTPGQIAAPAIEAAVGTTEPPKTAAATTTAAVRIAEILPAPLSGQAEWVELVNLGSSPVDLTGWTIGDASRDTRLEGDIPAGGRFVISTQDIGATHGQVVNRIGNGLNNDGDMLTLLDANGNVVDEVEYGVDTLPAPDRGLSIALEPGRWVVTALPTPGLADVTPLIAESLLTPSIRPETGGDEPLPLVATEVDGGVNDWMIVTFALIGVILVLILRRWTPPDASDAPAPEAAAFNGPPPDADDEAPAS